MPLVRPDGSTSQARKPNLEAAHDEPVGGLGGRAVIRQAELDGTQQGLLLLARDRLVKLNVALEMVHDLPGIDAEKVEYLRVERNRAKQEVERLLPFDAVEQLAERRAPPELMDRDRDPLEFRDTAIVIGIATVASIAVAPLAAWAVHEAMVKELVKAAVTGLFVGAATVAAEGLFERRRQRAEGILPSSAPTEPQPPKPIPKLPPRGERGIQSPSNIEPRTDSTLPPPPPLFRRGKHEPDGPGLPPLPGP
jgi:hypothetical protein